MSSSKKGIALLITLLFIVAITLSVGIGLKQVKEASNHVQNENFMLQTSVILDDVLKLLQNSKELKEVAKNGSSEILYLFLSQSSFIPFQAAGVKISLEIFSARSKLNINCFRDINATNLNQPNEKLDAFKVYLNNYSVNIAYGDILMDLMGGIKEDMSYNSDIFYEKPYLFRDYVISYKHLLELNDFYMKSYHDNSLQNIEFEKLFSFAKNRENKIDLNYTSAHVWELMLGVDKLRAEELQLGSGFYTALEDLNLNDEEKLSLEKFNVSYFEPYLDVTIEILENESVAKIHFEYDIKNAKGSNFSYEI